jgi:dTDP-L-rhamnose 4-epimerase
MKVLVTGGAGFIGSYLADALLREGYHVRVLDNLDPQVHGPDRQRPDYLAPDAELIVGDVRDATTVEQALEGIDAVFHEAAAVGVGQSMYEIARYVSVNSFGSAALLEGIIARRDHLKKVVVASSMSIYGEGAYRDVSGTVAYPEPRSAQQLRARQWELIDHEGRQLVPIGTSEVKPLAPKSVYAVTKRSQEELFLVTGATYGIPTVALRYFNTYGARQALSNPYTGLLAIVCSRLINGRKPVIFEDGWQLRDFVHVSDVIQANLLALKSDKAAGKAYNVGSGRAISVLDAVEILSKRLEFGDLPVISARARAGDIRHCFADLALIERDLGYEPRVRLEEGVDDLVRWVQTQRSVDHLHAAVAALEERGLVD